MVFIGRLFGIVCSILFLGLAAHAQLDIEQSTSIAERAKARSALFADMPAISERLSASEPQLALIDKQTWRYRAYINQTQIDDPDKQLPAANIVSFSYEALGVDNPAERPIMFAYNGGPGSTSVWLHMGAWGPKRVDTPGSPETYLAPPYALKDNQGFLIDVADLVFVDPVNTGLSAPIDTPETSAFNGVSADARSQCLFVRNWLKANNRLSSPIYVAGESYGSLRVAAMHTHPICRTLNLKFDGLILVSGLIDMEARRKSPYREIASFPTSAAIAWYHGLPDQTLWENNFSDYISAARAFATKRIGPDLLLGGYQSAEDKSKLESDLVEFLGIETDQNLPIAPQILRSQLPGLGRSCLYDARFMCNQDQQNSLGSPLPPLSIDALGDVFVEHLEQFVQGTQAFDIGETYTWRGNPALFQKWDYNRGSQASPVSKLETPRALAVREKMQHMAIQRYVKLGAPDLADGLRPPYRTRIMVASGYHDIITPFFGMEFPLKRAGVTIDALHLYEGGHMMYLDEKTGHQLAADVRSFIRNKN